MEAQCGNSHQPPGTLYTPTPANPAFDANQEITNQDVIQFLHRIYSKVESVDRRLASVQHQTLENSKNIKILKEKLARSYQLPEQFVQNVSAYVMDFLLDPATTTFKKGIDFAKIMVNLIKNIYKLIENRMRLSKRTGA